MDGVPGWPVAFRGSAAVAAGLVSWDVLRGRRYLRLFPDTYVEARECEPSFALRSHAAYRYVEGRGALAGYSAAEVLGASCGRPDGPAEVVVWADRQRRHPGLMARHSRPGPDDLIEVRGVLATSPKRTAYDLARRGELVQAVVAVDALANAHGFEPDELLHLAAGHRHSRGNRSIAEVLTLADRRAGSPMETRLRLVVVLGGLPRPEVQWPVQDEVARRAVWLDLAYPEHRIGIEYDGAVHTGPDAVLRDIARHTALLDQGWQVFRYTKHDVLRRPDRIVDQLRRALARSTCT
jgi:very-short-patch-repair endonuclease